MNIISKLTLRHMKLNKTRTLVTMIGVIISAAMITAVPTTLLSFVDVLVRHSYTNNGQWDVIYPTVNPNDLSMIKDDPNVKSLLLSKDIGYSILEGSQNNEKPYLYLTAMDDASLSGGMPIDLIEGRLPQNENEILVSQHIEDNASVSFEIGDTLSFAIGERYLKVSDPNQENPLSQIYSYVTEGDRPGDEGELFKETGEVIEYTVVGKMNRPAYESFYSPGYTVITYLDTNNLSDLDAIKVSVRLNKINKQAYKHALATASQLGIDESDMTFNRDAFTYHGATPDDGFNKTIYTLAALLFIIIIVGSVSLIYNAFAISISERSKNLGMLSSVGATRGQKKNSVMFESLCIGIIGIPLGILFGTLGIAITFHFINPIVQNVFSVDEAFQVILSPLTILIAVIISAITLLISAYIPAKYAAKISPMDAIRQSKDIKLTYKTVKTSRLTKFLFGFEGEIALKNLKRYKKRYKATVFSLFISIVLFLAISGYTFYLEKSMGLAKVVSNYDVILSSISSENNASLLTDLKQLPSVSDVSLYTTLALDSIHLSHEDSIRYLDENMNPFLYDDTFGTNLLDDEDWILSFSLIGLEDDSFADYSKNVGVDSTQFYGNQELHGIVLNKGRFVTGYQVSELPILDLQTNDILPLYQTNYDYNEIMDDWEKSTNLLDNVVIGAETDVLPLGTNYEDSLMYDIKIFVPRSELEKILTAKDMEIVTYQRIYIASLTPEKLDSDINSIIKNYSDIYCHNFYTQNRSNQQLILLFSVFAYGFIALITAICIANIFNTITTSIMLRKREFAMLKSVGMTPAAFRKMICYESIFYGLKALLYGLPVSFVIMIYLYRSLNNHFTGDHFSLPVTSIIVAIAAVFVVVFACMLYSFSKVKKTNTIDALKTELL